MATTVTAVIEGGLLRPDVPLGLAEGTRVEVIILPQENLAVDGRSAAAILAAIASLPTEGGEPSTSSDHDKVLYGDREAR